MTKDVVENLEVTEAKPTEKAKTRFRNWQDVGLYMREMKKYPVVKKIKAASGEPKDDTFELVRAFKELKDAQAFISSPEGFKKNDPEVQKRMSYLIWYVGPEVLEKL